MSIMNSRERVLAAFSLTEPDHVPRWCGASPELVDALLQHLTDYYIAVSQRTFDAAADVMDVFFSHDYILEETPVANVVAMFDAVTEFGIYHKA
jgi:uroporphyrinogen-III decarboxylase